MQAHKLDVTHKIMLKIIHSTRHVIYLDEQKNKKSTSTTHLIQCNNNKIYVKVRKAKAGSVTAQG